MLEYLTGSFNFFSGKADTCSHNISNHSKYSNVTVSFVCGH